jgi:prepilin-type N-terminal cleavage/methylation domain-containing protein
MFRLSHGSLADPRQGFSLVEIMVAMAISIALIAIVYGLLGNAGSLFYTADARMDLRSSIRLGMHKMVRELSQTGYNDAGVVQFSILDNSGVNGSDIIRFSIPVLCSSTATYLNASGDAANWGATTQWGCTTVACADTDDTCTTTEYKYIQYSMNNAGKLVRSTLDPFLAVKATQTLAENITGLQFSLAGTRMLTVTLTGQKMSQVQRPLSLSASETVLLMN